MAMTDVEQDLLHRIESLPGWVGEGETITGLEVRDRPLEATPKRFLDDPKRAERFGVEFNLTIKDRRRPVSVLIRVRIKPSRSDAPTKLSSPYVAVYVVNRVEDREELMIHDEITNSERYLQHMRERLHSDWFASWLQNALNRSEAKVFAPEVRL